MGQAGDPTVCSAKAGGVLDGEDTCCGQVHHHAGRTSPRLQQEQDAGHSAALWGGQLSPTEGLQGPSALLLFWVSSGLRESEGRRESPSFSSLFAPGAPPLASRPRPPTGVLLSSVAAGPRLTDKLLEVSDTAP